MPRIASLFLSLLALLVLSAAPAVASSPCTDACKVTAAKAYIGALVTHDASAVPLAPVCLRLEMGVPTGLTGADIRWQLENGPQYSIITAAALGPITVSGDTVTTDYVLTLRSGGLLLGYSAVHETFRVNPAGQITRIVATFTYATP